ncbi:hypothetical protein RIF29_34258 [Crotalaria pallida]|uniref:3-ketoacyl-CoA synthase n=1 Tax=Crotalaria pallida TaxID=3830 RepID=A0AAN9EEM9_CROPI
MSESNAISPLIKSKLSDIKQSLKLNYVKLGYHYLITHAMLLFLSLIVVIIATHIFTFSLQDLHDLWHYLRYNLVYVVICLAFLVFLLIVYFVTRAQSIYLVDFASYKPKDVCKCTRQRFMELSSFIGTFNEQSLEFQRKIMERSGIGESTYVPEALMRIPPNPSLAEARKEAEAVMFGAIDELFEKTKVKPKDIGIVIVNCSLFNPASSLASMVVNHYKLPKNFLSFNLIGMGCSAGNGRGCILLSSRRWDRRRFKYQLLHIFRTNKAANDKCFSCVTQNAYSTGMLGVSLSKDLMAVAGDALKTNIRTLGPLVLPMSEQLLFFGTLVGKKLFKMKVKPLIPDFTLAFNHFCIHVGGRVVLDEIQKNLQLTYWHMEPSRMTLYRFGNTSSSSLWYELAYTEANGRIKKSHRVWQIAFGSGFKCNSAVWKALRKVNPEKEKNPWIDEIDQFPVDVPEFSAI